MFSHGNSCSMYGGNVTWLQRKIRLILSLMSRLVQIRHLYTSSVACKHAAPCMDNRRAWNVLIIYIHFHKPNDSGENYIFTHKNLKKCHLLHLPTVLHMRNWTGHVKYHSFSHQNGPCFKSMCICGKPLPTSTVKLRPPPQLYFFNALFY